VTTYEGIEYYLEKPSAEGLEDKRMPLRDFILLEQWETSMKYLFDINQDNWSGVKFQSAVRILFVIRADYAWQRRYINMIERDSRKNAMLHVLS
jgi:hypothetical protein